MNRWRLALLLQVIMLASLPGTGYAQNASVATAEQVAEDFGEWTHGPMSVFACMYGDESPWSVLRVTSGHRYKLEVPSSDDGPFEAGAFADLKGTELTAPEVLERMRGRAKLLLVMFSRSMAGDLSEQHPIGLSTVTHANAARPQEAPYELIGETWRADYLPAWVPAGITVHEALSAGASYHIPPGATYHRLWLLPDRPGPYVVECEMMHEYHLDRKVFVLREHKGLRP